MKQIVDKPSPITGGILELCTESSSVKYRGEIIPFEKRYYHCVDSGAEFTDEELDNANLKQIYDTYRRRHSIPLAEELKQMRERYGIPSGAMSVILGLGENQFGLYEEGVVPTLSVGNLLALAMEPANLKEMLKAARYAFTDKQYDKYYRAIEMSLHPAFYEMIDIKVLDFEAFIPSFPTCILLGSGFKKPTTKKNLYNEYIYANE